MSEGKNPVDNEVEAEEVIVPGLVVGRVAAVMGQRCIERYYYYSVTQILEAEFEW